MRILLVDDDEGFLNTMDGVLREKGHDVITAQDGKKAREALEGQKIDLIISDVFMPTLDGVRFHSFVRAFTDARDIPFIFISGHDDAHLRGLAAEVRDRGATQDPDGPRGLGSAYWPRVAKLLRESYRSLDRALQNSPRYLG